jgi:hypothetical protein
MFCDRSKHRGSGGNHAEIDVQRKQLSRAFPSQITISLPMVLGAQTPSRRSASRALSFSREQPFSNCCRQSCWVFEMTRNSRSNRNVALLSGAATIGIIGNLFVSSACGFVFDSDAPKLPRGNVVTEHSFLIAAQSTKRLAEDCTTYGASECMSELCVHYKHDPATGYVCSRPCEFDSDCPAIWRCVSTYPVKGSEFCIPPADWEPTVGGRR